VTWTSPAFRAWLTPTETIAGTYRHSLLAEEADHRDEGLIALRELATRAHQDARERLERLVGRSLDPLGGVRSGFDSYPDGLHTTVLQGYLGEIIAGLVAENHEPHGRGWVVPAFLFRGHMQAEEELERRSQLGGPARPIPGRTGDDALAFEVDDEGSVVAWLWGEAKCTHDHSSTLISDAHAQLSRAIRAPVSIIQLIDVVSASQMDDRERWVAALRELMDTDAPPPRFDLCVYVCGRKPIRNTTWIDAEAPHASYTAPGPLHAIEVHFDDFDAVLITAYPRHTVSRA
jgi:hypothetical protein